MGKYTVFHPDHEALGYNIMGYRDAIGGDEFAHHFERHGLKDLKPDVYYPVQNFLDVLSDVSEDNNAMMDLIALGKKVVEDTEFPPEFVALSLEDALASLDDIYHSTDRGTNIGEIRFENVSNTRLRLIARTPYPDDLWYGAFFTIVRIFRRGATFMITYDAAAPRREEGGQVTIYNIDLQ